MTYDTLSKHNQIRRRRNKESIRRNDWRYHLGPSHMVLVPHHLEERRKRRVSQNDQIRVIGQNGQEGRRHDENEHL